MDEGVEDEDVQAGGEAWGDDISEKRKALLEGILRHWERETDHGAREGPFDGEPGPDEFPPRGFPLSGGDVFWLASRRPLLDPSPLHLEGADLTYADLSDAKLGRANLKGATLFQANLSGAELGGANLSGATLFRINLSGARLHAADLSCAAITQAELSGAFLGGANLRGADLSQTDLSGTNLSGVDLSGANLRGVRMDVATDLSGARLSTATRLVDVVWNAVPLARVAWENLPVVGDEPQMHNQALGGTTKAAPWRGAKYEEAVRAYRLLAVTLRSQGLNEHADRYAYRAQVCQRTVFRLRRQWGAWTLQTLLALLAGYGYRLWRILAAYGVVLLVFTVLYWLLGIRSFRSESGIQALWDSFLVSLSAVHGRTTFEQLGAWTAAAWVAAIESVVGIVIEGVFVAMLVQRFFGSR